VFKTSPSNAGCVGSVPGQGTKIPHALQQENQNVKQKQYCNTFNEDFFLRTGLSLKKKRMFRVKIFKAGLMAYHGHGLVEGRKRGFAGKRICTCAC